MLNTTIFGITIGFNHLLICKLIVYKYSIFRFGSLIIDNYYEYVAVFSLERLKLINFQLFNRFY